MYTFPKTPKQIKARIRSYESALRKEKRAHGFYDDSYGKRYLLGPLYLLANDIEGALKNFTWFAGEFTDDIGEPFHHLCWTLALHRAGREKEAVQKLLHTMLSNLYLIPRLLDEVQEEHDMWHASTWGMKDYAGYMPELCGLWDDEAKAWARGLYHSEQFTKIRERYVAIYHQLKEERNMPVRKRLVEEASELEKAQV